jgi:hypothetical protein
MSFLSFSPGFNRVNGARKNGINRFNGLRFSSRKPETIETVRNQKTPSVTRLKPGENEIETLIR